MMKRLLYSVVMTLMAFTAFGHSTQQITHDENQNTEYQSISPPDFVVGTPKLDLDAQQGRKLFLLGCSEHGLFGHFSV